MTDNKANFPQISKRTKHKNPIKHGAAIHNQRNRKRETCGGKI